MDLQKDLNMRGLTDAILKSYREEEHIIKIEAKNQISDATVGELIEKLRDLIFAGFFSKRRLNKDSIDYYLGELLEGLIHDLKIRSHTLCSMSRTTKTSRTTKWTKWTR